MYRKFCPRCGEEHEEGEVSIYKYYCDYCGKEISKKRQVEVELPEPIAKKAQESNCPSEFRFVVLGLCDSSFYFYGEPLCCVDCLIKLLQQAKEKNK